MNMEDNTYNRFDKIDNYDEEIPKHVAEYLNKVKTAKIINIIKKYFCFEYRKNSNIKGIDLGCGTGACINRIQLLCPTFTVDGLDYSKKQIELAKKKGLTNVFIHSTMSDIFVNDGTYYFAYAINSVHHLPSKTQQRKALNEIYRILKPAGIFIIHEINTKNPIIKIYMNYIFPKIRNIDDGSEIWLEEQLVSESDFEVEDIDYFTFVPDFTPKFLMGIATKFDKILGESRLAKLGAHVMYVLRK